MAQAAHYDDYPLEDSEGDSDDEEFSEVLWKACSACAREESKQSGLLETFLNKDIKIDDDLSEEGMRYSHESAAEYTESAIRHVSLEFLLSINQVSSLS